MVVLIYTDLDKTEKNEREILCQIIKPITNIKLQPLTLYMHSNTPYVQQKSCLSAPQNFISKKENPHLKPQ